MSSWLKRLLSSTIPPIALMCSHASAQAAIYAGHWDPLFGAPLNNLGWEGDVTLNIPSACSTVGHLYTVDPTVCAASISMLQVTLYDKADPSVALQLLNFIGQMPPGFLYQYELAVSGLLELNTNGAFTQLLAGNISETQVSGIPANFGLSFSLPGGPGTTTGPTLLAQWASTNDCDEVETESASSLSMTYFHSTDSVSCSARSYQGDPTKFALVNAVPEPGSLALVGLGLLACVSIGGRRGRRLELRTASPALQA